MNGLKSVLTAAALAMATTANAATITGVTTTGIGTFTDNLSVDGTFVIDWVSAYNNTFEVMFTLTLGETERLALAGYLYAPGAGTPFSSNVLIQSGATTLFQNHVSDVVYNRPGTGLTNGLGALIELTAGVYSFRLREPNNPDAARATFTLSPVPLPAGGLLLLGALGAFVLARRRTA